MKIVENILWLVILLCIASLAIISVIAWNNLVMAAVFITMIIMWVFTFDFNK
jgi:hypothetical protein